MKMPTSSYYAIQDKAHGLWMKAQDLISMAEVQYAHGRIDECEWYRMLSDARAIQEQAMKLEKESLVNAQVELWRKQYLGDDDRSEQLREETELRGAI
jgi:hypothetical protein